MTEILEQAEAEDKIKSTLDSVLTGRAGREAFRVQRPLRSALPFLASSIAVGALTVLCSMYTPCYSASAAGVDLGLVSSRTMAVQTTQQVEAQLSYILNEDYSLPLEIDYTLSFAAKEHISTTSEFSEALYANVSDVKEAYVLTVDGVVVGAHENKSVLDAALTQLQSSYVGEATQSASYANDMRITKKYIPADESFSGVETLAAALQSPVTVDTVYEVQKGDTIAALCARFGMGQQEFMQKNMTLPLRGLLVGQIVTVEKTVPLLSVTTVEETNYTRAVASPVREVSDGTLYEGERKIITQGRAGEAKIRSNMNFVNGTVQYEEILSQKVITEAAETVVAVGTKARPAFYSTGTLQRPTQGNITSPFGYRTLFGNSEFHAGMDIANSYGTAIRAADSGIVTFSGYKGSYGNLVIIDHGNGMQTYYAHASANMVSVGQGVTKGDHIAAMGRTGRATGNHCHFEVRIKGEAVNPANYL